jgi:S-adenosylhomocysteine hydrolase
VKPRTEAKTDVTQKQIHILADGSLVMSAVDSKAHPSEIHSRSMSWVFIKLSIISLNGIEMLIRLAHIL